MRDSPAYTPAMDIRALLPDLAWVRSYKREFLRKDIVAGIVLTAILVPAGMGYAEASGLPPIVGLYASIVPLAGLRGPRAVADPGPRAGFVARPDHRGRDRAAGRRRRSAGGRPSRPSSRSSPG